MARYWAARRWRQATQRYRGRALPAGPAPSGAELDALAGALDLSRLSDEQFVQLLVTVHMLGHVGTGVSLQAMSTQSLVDLIAQASKKQLKLLSEHEELRTFLLEELFRRMSGHLIVEKTRNISMAVTWNFTNGAADAPPLVFQTLVEDGECESAPDLGLEPDATVTVSIYDFIRMATGGNALAMSMFVSGKIKVRGDYSVAARFITYFDIPRPSS
ncbi:MAG: SCP2 sterol-binding domain-containing protein [Thermocrispum sp.]